jgi:hypothetical protein
MSDKKSKPEYTKQDSASFKRYEEFIDKHGGKKESLFSDEFRGRYKVFKGLGIEDSGGGVEEAKKIPRNLKGAETEAPGYLSAAQKEMSNSIISSTSNLNKLQAGYDKDYSVFQGDSTRYQDVRTSLGVLESEWEARESASPTTFESMFNLYPEDSSMGILSTQIGELRDRERELYDKTFKKHGKVSGNMSSTGDPGISYEDKLKMRKSGLNKLSGSIKKKQEFYDSLQKIELDKKGY